MITVPAIVAAQFRVFLRASRARPTGSVRMLSELVTISGQRKSFQALTNVKMASVAIAGVGQREDDRAQNAQLGGAVDARRFEDLVGDRAEELAHEEDAEDLDGAGRDEPEVGVGADHRPGVVQVDHDPVERDEVDLEGTISVSSSTKNSVLRPGKRSLAKAYAAAVPNTTLSATIDTETMMLFRR